MCSARLISSGSVSCALGRTFTGALKRGSGSILAAGILGNEPVAPDLVEEFGLRYHTFAMAQQIGQHVEDLRFHIDDLAGASQLDGLDAQLAITESNPHMMHRRPHDAQIDVLQARDRRAPGILACGES
jgi:hypothetical protein